MAMKIVDIEKKNEKEVWITFSVPASVFFDVDGAKVTKESGLSNLKNITSSVEPEPGPGPGSGSESETGGGK